MADNENVKKSEYEKKCSVPGCKKTVGEATLFSIPKRVRSTPEIQANWLLLFKIRNRSTFPSVFNVCEKHFEEGDIIKSAEDSDNSKSADRTALSAKAIPVHFLPSEETPVEEFDFYDDVDERSDSSADDYPKSVDSVSADEKIEIPIVTMEEQTDEFHDAIEKVDEPITNVELEKDAEKEDPSGMDETPEEEKVYHDLKPHITGEEEIFPSEPEVSTAFTPKITNLEVESSKLEGKESEEKILKVIKRVAPARNPVQEEDEEESPTKRPRRNVIHKLIKPRHAQEPTESPMKSTPVKKDVVIVKKIIKTPLKVVKKVEKTPITPKVITPKVVEKPTVPAKVVAVPSRVVAKTPVQTKIVSVPAKVVTKTPVIVKPSQKLVVKIDKKEMEQQTNGAAASRSRRNVVHKLIKPRGETPVKATILAKVVSPPPVSKPVLKGKVEIYSSLPKPEEKTPKKDEKSPKIVMISSKLIQGSPKFVKSPQILKISPRNIVASVKTPIKSPPSIVVTPKKPTVLAKVAVKRLTSKIVPIEDDNSRPRRNVPHKFIKTTNNGAEKEKPTPQKSSADPVDTMHVALLKEFLSDSKSVQMDVVKRKATSIARIIGLKSFKASDDWTKQFIAGYLATCNGGSAN